jgi:hypothetical protein
MCKTNTHKQHYLVGDYMVNMMVIVWLMMVNNNLVGG